VVSGSELQQLKGGSRLAVIPVSGKAFALKEHGFVPDLHLTDMCLPSQAEWRGRCECGVSAVAVQ
jgi:hypothetical protein